MDKLSFYWWRAKMLLCYIKHDWEIAYIRQHVGGPNDRKYAGRRDCRRCNDTEYFDGVFK